MNHLKSIHKKTAQQYLDIINSDYNLNRLTEEIHNSFIKYDINYIKHDFEIIYEIRIFADTSHRRNDVVLWTRFNSKNIYFGKLDKLLGDHIIQNGTYIIRDNAGNYAYSYRGINERLRMDANECKLEIYLIYSKEPVDIVKESLYFLLNKYGFKMEQIGSIHDDNKIKLVKNIT